MLSPFFQFLLAAENRLLPALPTYFGVQLDSVLPLILAVVGIVLGILYGNFIRMPDHGWRVGLIAASFLAALSVILFWEYKLGVDLQGGAILVYEVDVEATAENHPQGRGDDWKMSDLMQVLKRRLNPDGLKEIVIRPFGPKQVEIVVPEVEKDEVDVIKERIIAAGVLRFLILADSATRDQRLWEAATAQSEDAVGAKNRLARNVIDPDDPTGERIMGVWVGLDRQPGSDQETRPFLAPEALYGTRLRNGETGQLIDINAGGPTAQQDFQRDPVSFFAKRGIRDVEVLMTFDPDYDVRGSDLARASEDIDEGGGWCIRFNMKPDGAWKMRHLTNENKPVGNTTRKLGIVWDNKLVSAPNIQSVISDSGQITGRFTQREVKEKVELLRSGSMPVVLKRDPISDDRIGATLGLDTVRKGSQAILISLSIVLVFVMFYYRTAGVIACFALVLNMMLTVALMFALKAPFTLPGLAGLVLTVGMSVDANVLIYERIREELERGAALRMAIRNGFDKALVTIIDSNVTTLLTAVILYVIGTDQVRGFGMTLILGIVTSMFTAIFCSRAILEIGERAYRWNTLSMLKFFTHANIDWMGSFKPAAIASVVLIAAGLVATVYRGAGIFDIDLAGGTSVQFILDPTIYGKETADQIRARIKDAIGKEINPATKSSIDHNTYQKFVAQTTVEGAAAEDQMVWKVDSSLEDVELLQDIILKAFRTPDGREGLQTYGVSYHDVKELQSGEAAPPPKAPAPPLPATPDIPETPEKKVPAADQPSVEAPPAKEATKPEPAKPEPANEATPKKEEPKAEEPKVEAPKPEEPKKTEPAKKGEEPAKKDEEKKEEEKQDSSDCQPEEEKKDETPKAEDKPVEKTDDKPADKAAEPKVESPKAEEPKTETPKTETPKTEAPAAVDADPTKQIPALPPIVLPTKPTAPEGIALTEAVVDLKNTTISGDALVDRIQAAAEKAINQRTVVEVSNPGWSPRDNKSFSKWTVTFSLPKEEAEKVLKQLELDLKDQPVWQTSSKIGGQVSEDTRWRAVLAIIGSIVGMIVYMWIRFHKISWGIAAAVALAHDALVMLGAIAISYWLAGPLGFLMIEEFKISLPVVAAFLTLIGYSVNDTIVIFDRVREIRGKSPNINGDMINLAVNQTLSRTFLTAGTTLIVITILFFMGGSGIHAFAFALVVGVISGSYSTVFIASPLLVYLIGLDQKLDQVGSTKPTPNNSTRGAA
ncbi:bifunctional preprotein translocase subunit SecD/SecF [Anatilimnocola aggregata]|uniref:Multifunctional fusion protein n=1 Tax=Anatilimnocola aggregata TaxID=2528021 RepID=A0A517YKL2_9BACT|nr:protein translocase subunit SecD [Anatilimnocola aggregata]QDU30771.1 bifunctional preprotein translocase subunit SecD/SecF [Anatilimnocola aggregata]